MRLIKKSAAVLAASALVLGLAACSSDSDGGTGSSGEAVKLSLVGYSTIAEVYAELIPAFQKTEAGKKVTFEQSYGGSGAQARAVVAGQPADVVHLSLPPDVDKLVDADLVDKDWADRQGGSVPADSVVVLVVRKGNPKNIKTFDDVVKPGVSVVTANPVTSGGARWNVLAAYGSQVKAGKSEADAEAFLGKLFKNVLVFDKSARESVNTFVGGKGDVLLAYENEAIAAKKAGKELDYIIPDSTLLIEAPIAAVKTSKHPEQVKAFIDFVFTDEAQKIWAKFGYRPVLESEVDKTVFPTPSGLFKSGDVGGWDGTGKKLFKDKTGVVAKLVAAAGK